MAIRIAVTGRPGVGKTTLCMKVYSMLKNSGIDCSGFVTKEIRGNGRTGFKVVDLESGKSFVLATKKTDCSPALRVGKYCVNVEEFESYIEKLASSLFLKNEKRSKGERPLKVIIDEVGPMELKSRKFIEFIGSVVESDLDILFSIHMRSNHPLLRSLREKLKVYTITEENRDEMAEKIFRMIAEG